jgi:hypothetical protein
MNRKSRQKSFETLPTNRQRNIGEKISNHTKGQKKPAASRQAP